MKRNNTLLCAVFVATLSLGTAGCQDQQQSGRLGDVIRFDKYCNMDNLPRSLRQTYILIDAKALKKSDLATDFAKNNAFVRDLALAFGNPRLALASGLSDPRERISVFLVPADGSPAQLTFTGCIPGLSAEEEAAARQGSSSVGQFFTGDALKGMDDDAEKFQLALVGGLTAAAKSGVDALEPQTGPVAATPLFAGLRASRGVLEAPKGTVPRYVIVSDLSAARFEDAGSTATPSKQGQDAGFKAGGDFGLSDVMIVQPPGAPLKGQDFLRGFLLAQGGRLVSYSSEKPVPGDRAPKWIKHFEGEAAYPSRTERVKLVIADDGKGNLASSWLTLLGSSDQSIPLTGQVSCSSPAICKVVSDDKGFAQAWSSQPGGEPEFANDIPFGGMRKFSFDIQGQDLKGAVSDAQVQIGDDSSKNSIAVTTEER